MRKTKRLSLLALAIGRHQTATIQALASKRDRDTLQAEMAAAEGGIFRKVKDRTPKLKRQQPRRTYAKIHLQRLAHGQRAALKINLSGMLQRHNSSRQ
jgi:transcription initiation factor TFIID subunit TAF12